jgi:hypothetical protein
MESSKICIIVSFDKNYEGIAEISVYDNIKKYCNLHGYSLWIDKQENISHNRGSQWNKISISLEILNDNDFDWLFFMDSDSIIMNTSKKLEEFIDENYSFIVPSHNMEPIDTPILNPQGDFQVITSHFFVRNNTIGKNILMDIWNAKEWPQHMLYNEFDYEQRQTRITINKPEFKEHVKVLNHKELNRFWFINSPFHTVRNPNINNNVWEPGDFLVHVTSYPLYMRRELISDLNYFSGGLLATFEREKNKITFSAISNLGATKVVIYNTRNEPLINYSFESMNYRTYYVLFTNDDIDSQDVIIKGFDENNKVISLKFLEKKS